MDTLSSAWSMSCTFYLVTLCHARHARCFICLLRVLCVRHTPIVYLWHGNSIFGMIRIFTFDLGIMTSTCFIVNTFYLGNLCTECPMFGAFDKVFRRFTWKLLRSVCSMNCAFLKCHGLRITLTFLLTCVRNDSYLFSLWSWSLVLFMLHSVWSGYSVLECATVYIHYNWVVCVRHVPCFAILTWVFYFRQAQCTFDLNNLC